MDYKKAYKDALERAREFCDVGSVNSINNNKENERLRKITISFLKEFADKGYENAVECIDWLEQQKK